MKTEPGGSVLRMFPFTRILVGLADPRDTRGLLPYASYVAARSPASSVHIAHVTPEDGVSIEEAVARHFGSRPRVTAEVTNGAPIDRLLQIAGQGAYDLLLIGHHRKQGGRRSLARRLAMKAPCAVWMVPDGSPAQVTSVLTPIDYSERSGQALRTGCEIAAATAARVTAVHVSFDNAASDAAYLDFERQWAVPGMPVKARFENNPGVTATIARVAAEEEADLVVMGTRGRTIAAAILLGSESEQMIRETDIPILLVKKAGERRGLLELLLDEGALDKLPLVPIP